MIAVIHEFGLAKKRRMPGDNNRVLCSKSLPEVSISYKWAQTYDASKPTIVLFHSFLMDADLFAPQFKDPVYHAFNLIAVDEHGHGRTIGRSSFSFWNTAEDSLELMTVLGIERFFVLGTSQGGFIALRMALLAPQRVLGLILLGTNADAEISANKHNFKLSRDKWCETEIPTDAALLVKSSSFGGPKIVGEEIYARICTMWKKRHAGPGGYDPALECLCGRDSLVERLHEIIAPVLIMHGTEDKVYSVESAQAWSAKLKNLWKFVIVDGGYHYLSFVSPGLEKCREHIPEFIHHALKANTS